MSKNVPCAFSADIYSAHCCIQNKIERIHRAVVRLFSLQVSVHPLPCFQYAIALCVWPGMELISLVLLFRDRVGHRHDTVQQILPAAVCRKDSRYSPALVCNTIL